MIPVKVTLRRWKSGHRWTTMALLARAFLTVTTADERDQTPHPTGRIPLANNDDHALRLSY
jgi:hypothetical protein